MQLKYDTVSLLSPITMVFGFPTNLSPSLSMVVWPTPRVASWSTTWSGPSKTSGLCFWPGTLPTTKWLNFGLAWSLRLSAGHRVTSSLYMMTRLTLTTLSIGQDTCGNMLSHRASTIHQAWWWMGFLSTTCSLTLWMPLNWCRSFKTLIIHKRAHYLLFMMNRCEDIKAGFIIRLNALL